MPDHPLITSRANSQEDIFEIERYLCKTSLKYLCEEKLHFKDWDTCHDELETWYAANEKKWYKIVLIPRYHLKTSILTIGQTIQDLLNNPDKKILLASAVWDNARSFLAEIKKYLEQGELPMLFGDFRSDKWNQDEIVLRQRQRPDKSPSIDTAGIEKTLTSQHYDIIRADDLVTRETCTTKEQMQKVKKFHNDLLKLANPKGGRVELIGTHWHYNDLYAELLEENGLRISRGERPKYTTYIRSATKDGTFDTEPIFPKMWTIQKLKDMYFSVGSYEYDCTPAETPILMPDFSFKKISEIKAGDSIIGWDENASKSNRRTLRISKVLAVFSKMDSVKKFIMESGRIVRCTSDHRWYTGRSGKDRYHIKYSAMKKGRKLQFVFDPIKKEPTPEQKKKAIWLGGIFDGEGHCHDNAIYLAQCQRHNPEVTKAIGEALVLLGFDYKYNAKSKCFHMRGGAEGKIRFMEWCEPVKAFKIIKSLHGQGCRFVKGEDKILDIVDDGFEPVHALETETGNYIAWGYASSNCNFNNQPISDQTRMFKPPFRYWDDLGLDPTHAITVDLAASDVTSDYVVITDCAMNPSNQLCVVEYARGHFDVNQTLEEIFKMAQKYLMRQKTRKVGVEAVAYQKVFVKLLEEEMKKRNIFFEVVPIRQNKNKVMRILDKEGLLPRYESGNLLLKRGMVELEDEFEKFPVGKHDDILDTIEMTRHVLEPRLQIKDKVYIPKQYRGGYLR